MPMVTIMPGGELIPVSPGETILEGLYNSGFSFRIGCRRGGCAICKVDVLEGSFTYNRPIAASVISDEERENGTCLTCRAVPDGDITIQMRDESLRMTNAMLRQLRLKAYEKEAAARTGETVNGDAPVPGAPRTAVPHTTT